MKKNLLLVLILTTLGYACTKKEDVKPNTPPSAFTITSKQTNTDLLLTWTKAQDPEGDLVTYTIVYKDTLAKNLSDTSYVIKNVPYSSTIAGSIIAKDAKGASTSVPFSVTTYENENSYVLIPDINFEKALIELKIDDVQDGKLLRSNAEKVKELELNGGAWFGRNETIYSIKNLQGIESFINLEKLHCDSTQLMTLDVSKNVNLTVLGCSGNQLTSLDVSKNVNLTSLSCSPNQLTSLDISKNTSLTSLDCSRNQLTSLDVSKNVNLIELWCYNTQLTSLDISKNTSLTSLDCSFNRLTSLDVSKNVNLTLLRCFSNQLTNLDVSKNVNLISLECYTNQLTSLDVSKNVNLIELDCFNNQLKSLDVSKNVNLAVLSCDNTQLTSLNVSKNTNLLALSCTNNPLQTICVNSLTQPKTNWQKDATASYKVCN